MTWVAVVKFWAYQAYQLQLIVYTNLTITLHGLELFSSANRQWINAVIGTNQTTISLPIAYSKQHFASIAIEKNVSWSATAFNIFGLSAETLSTLDVHSRWCDSETVNSNGGSAYIISIGI